MITQEDIDNCEDDELLPCPFCGGDAGYMPAFGVICNTCQCGLPSTYSECVSAWNTRANLQRNTDTV